MSDPSIYAGVPAFLVADPNGIGSANANTGFPSSTFYAAAPAFAPAAQNGIASVNGTIYAHVRLGQSTYCWFYSCRNQHNLSLRQESASVLYNRLEATTHVLVRYFLLLRFLIDHMPEESKSLIQLYSINEK